MAFALRLVLLLSILSCSTTTSNLKKTSKLTILFINDTHGFFNKHTHNGTPNVGGFASFSTLVKKIRNEVQSNNGKLFVFHAGDMNTGTLKSNFLNAKPDIAALNHIGIDGMAIGEHEVAKPLNTLKKQMDSANFPFLSANVFEKKNGTFLGKAYIVKKFRKTKIYVFGVTTPRAINYIPKTRASKLKIYSPLRTSINYSKRFPKKSIVILLSHLGHKYDLKLARKNPNIDLIIGGHSHNITRKPRIIGNALVVQAGEKLEGAGRIDLVIKNGLIIDYRYIYIPINQKIKEKIGKTTKFITIEENIEEDTELLDKLKAYDELYEDVLSTPIATNKTLLTKRVNDMAESPIGNLVTDAILKKANCDIALISNDEIKADLLEGEITPRDILALHSKEDTIMISRVTGNKLINILEESYSNRKRFLQISGMMINLDFAINGNASVVIKSINGRYSKPSSNYSLCTSRSFATNNLTPPTLKSIKNKIDTKLPIYEGIVDLIKSQKTINYEVENRITVNLLN